MVSDRRVDWFEREIVGREVLLDLDSLFRLYRFRPPYHGRPFVLVFGPGRVFMTGIGACSWILVDGPFDRKVWV